jgi:hypothetical protein
MDQIFANHPNNGGLEITPKEGSRKRVKSENLRSANFLDNSGIDTVRSKQNSAKLEVSSDSIPILPIQEQSQVELAAEEGVSSAGQITPNVGGDQNIKEEASDGSVGGSDLLGEITSLTSKEGGRKRSRSMDEILVKSPNSSGMEIIPKEGSRRGVQSGGVSSAKFLDNSGIDNIQSEQNSVKLGVPSDRIPMVELAAEEENFESCYSHSNKNHETIENDSDYKSCNSR